MPKILMVATVDLTLKGFLLPFADYFRRQGWQVQGLAQGAEDCPVCQSHFDQVWNIDWSRNPLDLQNLRMAPQRIQELVRQQHYDIVHVHTPVAAFVTRFALRSLRRELPVAVIYTAHGFHFYRGGNPLKNQIFLNLEKLAAGWTDHLVVINREDEFAARYHHFLPLNQIHYCPGIGVDLQYYQASGVDANAVIQLRRSLNLTPQNDLFLAIAEFNPGKRHRDILTAFAQLQSPQTHLAFAGDGSLRPEMEALAESLGIRQQVHFLGVRGDIPTLIRAAIATIHASEREGLPRSIMESLALEVPVIGTQIRGTTELLAGGGGILVPVGNPKAICTAMRTLLDHPERRKTMGENGRTSMAQFDLKSVLQHHESLYAQALDRSRQLV